MRTVCCSSRLRDGGCLPVGGLPRERSAWERGFLPRGCLTDTSPPTVSRMTDACENITGNKAHVLRATLSSLDMEYTLRNTNHHVLFSVDWPSLRCHQRSCWALAGCQWFPYFRCSDCHLAARLRSWTSELILLQWDTCISMWVIWYLKVVFEWRNCTTRMPRQDYKVLTRNAFQHCAALR